MLSILNIILTITVAAIVVLQLLGVAVSQKAINLTYGIVILIFLLANGGWWHI